MRCAVRGNKPPRRHTLTHTTFPGTIVYILSIRDKCEHDQRGVEGWRKLDIAWATLISVSPPKLP